MRAPRSAVWFGLAVLVMLVSNTGSAQAQGRGKEKHYQVSSDRAYTVTRTVLVERGYQIVRVERVGPDQVVYFRRGNNGRGKGKGPLQRMVIRRVQNRVMFVDADPGVLVDIDVRLKL
jgi:hypothetical protein